MCVSLDEEGHFKRMERFLPSQSFSNPIDLEFNTKGELYLLEYGQGWFSQNEDARLVRLRYTSGNRKPIAQIECSERIGTAPLNVHLSAAPSIDHDHYSIFSSHGNTAVLSVHNNARRSLQYI